MFAQNEPSKYFFVFGASFIFLLFSLLVSSSLLFMLHLTLPPHLFLVCVIATSIFTALSCLHYFSGKHFAAFFSLTFFQIIIFALAFLTSQSFFDPSYDGQAYHADLVYQLAHNWNPIYQTLTPSQTSGANRWWENNYSLGAETYESTLYKLTGTFETAKTFNLLLIVAASCITLALLLNFKSIPTPVSVLISLLVLNPTTIGQSLTLYIDGQLFSLLICNICTLVICFFSKKIYPFIVLFLITAVAVNLKLTAPVYLLIVDLPLILAIFHSDRAKELTQSTKTLVAGLAVGLLIIGFHPYITNTLFHGSPLYPVAGKGAFDIRSDNIPQNFFDKTSPEILFLSAFSSGSNERGEGKFSQLKTPFTINPSELQAFSQSSVINGGWGPLFSGALVLSLIALAMILLDRQSSGKKVLFALLAVLLISCFINPMSSVARYTPQFFLFPVIITIYLFLQQKPHLQLLAATMLGVLIVNSIIVGNASLNYNLKTSSAWKTSLSQLASQGKDVPITVDFKAYRTKWRALFAENNIAYIEKEETSCRHPKRLFVENIISTCD